VTRTIAVVGRGCGGQLGKANIVDDGVHEFRSSNTSAKTVMRCDPRLRKERPIPGASQSLGNSYGDCPGDD